MSYSRKKIGKFQGKLQIQQLQSMKIPKEIIEKPNEIINFSNNNYELPLHD